MNTINLHRHACFDMYFRRYYQALCYFASHILNNDNEAEDVVQSVFAHVFDKRICFESEEHIRHYLYRAVYNRCLSSAQTLHAHNDALADWARAMNEEQDTDFVTEMAQADTYRRLLAAIDNLPPQQSAVFRMAYIEDASNEEIAERLSISINTVKVHKRKAKIALRNEMLKMQ